MFYCFHPPVPVPVPVPLPLLPLPLPLCPPLRPPLRPPLLPLKHTTNIKWQKAAVAVGTTNTNNKGHQQQGVVTALQPMEPSYPPGATFWVD